MENKLNKYGCRPSGDVCLEHDSPLITFGICEDSPELKDFIQQIRQDTIKEMESNLFLKDIVTKTRIDTLRQVLPEKLGESTTSYGFGCDDMIKRIIDKAKEIWGIKLNNLNK